MPTRRITTEEASAILAQPVKACTDPDHKPKADLPDGIYHHTCPTCGSDSVFRASPRFRQG